MHQAWLDMIKLNSPTHELEKSDFGNKQESTMISIVNQNEEVLLVQINHGCEKLHKPFRSVK
jgi:hypothetical protein